MGKVKVKEMRPAFPFQKKRLFWSMLVFLCARTFERFSGYRFSLDVL